MRNGRQSPSRGLDEEPMPELFELDPRIAAGSVPLAETNLCLVRLMNDSRYPWVLLVPRRPAVTEIFDLSLPDRHALVDLASAIAARMAETFDAEKMNVGSLGNRVRQFHLHIVVRRSDDPAWPDAVWNGTAPVPYERDALDLLVDRLRGVLPLRLASE